MDLKQYIARVPDFPEKGIIFRDISPLIAYGKAYGYATQQIVEYAKDKGVELIVRSYDGGFIVGCQVAYQLGMGFGPCRKKGILPRETVEVNYGLVYGNDVLQLHKDAINPGQKVLVCDDLLASGGTIAAT